MANYTYDPFDSGGYANDPYAGGTYNPYKASLPTQPSIPESQVVNPGAPLAPPIAPRQAPTLPSFLDFKATQTGKPEGDVYRQYVEEVVPAYMQQLGLTPEQQAAELDLIRKTLVAPKTPNLYDRATARVDDAISNTLPNNPKRRMFTDEAGLVQEKKEQALDTAKVEVLRKKFGTEDAGWFKSSFDAMASGLAGMYGGAASFAGRNTGWKWLEESGTDAKLEAAALMKADPSFKDKLFNAGGSALGAIGTSVAAAVGAGSAGVTGLPLWILGAAASGIPEAAGVAEQTYDTAYKNTGNKKQAEEQAWTAFLLNAPISTIANKVAFFTQGGKVVATLGRGVVSQGTEEALQQLLTNYLGYEDKVGKGVAENAILGGLVGGPVSLIMRGGAQNTPPTEVTDLPAQPEVVSGQRSLQDILNEFGEQPKSATASGTQVKPREVKYDVRQTDGQEVQPTQQDGQEQDQQVDRQTNGQEGQPIQQDGQKQEVTSAGQVLPVVASTNGSTPTETLPTFPKDLAGAKPRYSYKDNNYTLKFTNDVDRALYVVSPSKGKRSKFDVDYMAWLQTEVYPGETESQIRGRGEVIAKALRTTASSASPTSKTLVVPQYFRSARSQPAVTLGEAPTPITQTTDTLQAPARLSPETDAVLPTVTQGLEDLQVPGDPQLTAEVAEEMITRSSDAAEQTSNPSQAAAFIAAETESPTTGAIETTQPKRSLRRTKRNQPSTVVEGRVGKPSSTSNLESNNQGVEAVQPSIPRESSERVGDTSGSQSSYSQSVAEARDEVLNPPEDTRIPAKDVELQRLSTELSLLPSDEAKQLSNYLYNAFDVGFGQPYVDRAKLMRARAVVAETKKAYKLKKLGVRDDPEVIKLITNPVTGEALDSRVIRTTFAQTPLGAGVKSFLGEGNLVGALQGLYLNGSTPLVRAVAGRLANMYMGDVKIKIASLGKDLKGNQIGGQWSPSTLELRLDPIHGLTEHVLLHEAIHAATVQGLSNAKTPIQKAAVQELTAIFIIAQKTLDRKQYAFTNLHEFVAEAFSNPELQSQLYQIKGEAVRASLWQRFINAVTRLVGLDNLLGHTMNVAEALFMSPVADGDMKGSFAATVAPQPNTGPIDITVERTGKGYAWIFDREASILNMGKQIEKALKTLKITIPDAMKVRLQNTLKRSQAEAALRKWTATHWDGITGSVQNVMKQHGRLVEEVEKFLEQLQVLGRAEQKIKEFPTRERYQIRVLEAQQNAEEFAVSGYSGRDKGLRRYQLEEALRRAERDLESYNPAKMDELRRKAQVELKAADEYLKDLEQNNPTYFKSMIAVANKIKAATDATLDARLASRNNMTAARLSAMKTAFRSRYMDNGFYIPLQLDNNDGTQVTLLKQSLGVNFKADQPLSRIYAQAALTAYANEANTEKQQVLALARQFNLTDAFTNKPLIEIGPVGNLKRDPHTGEITEGQDNLLLDKDSVGVWVDGNYVKMRITDPGLRQALAPIAIEDMPQAIGLAIGAARHFNQLMSVARTSLNPGFAIFNFLRDQGAVAIQLDPKVRYGAYYAALLPSIVSGFYNTFSGAVGGKQSAKYLKALDDGAFISQRSYVGLTDTIRDVQQDLAPTLGGRLKAGLGDPFSTKVGQVLTGFAQSLETATRLAIYDASIASGLSPKEAAYQAKTTTTNFERKSNFTNAVGPFYMFVNAKAQGTRTLIDKAVGIDANPRTQAALGSLVALGLIAAAIGYEESEKDKDGISKYFKIADYKRDTRVIVKEGTPGIPLPQEASLFYVLGNTVGDVVMGPATFSQGLSRFVKNLIQQAAPLGAGQTDPTAKNTNIADYLMRLFLPTMAQPVYDLATNRDTFGRPITPESLRFKGKADYQKYTRNENTTSIAMAKALYEGDYADVSPASLTYLAKYLEGGAVSFWRDALNPKEPNYEGQSTNPIGKRFTSEAVPYGDTQVYKEALDELKRVSERVRGGSLAERRQAFGADKQSVDLYNRFKAFEDFKTRTLFRGYDKFSDAQLKQASAMARDRQMQLMREYYILKGIVQ